MEKIVFVGVFSDAPGSAKNRTIPAMLSTSNAELYAIAGRNEEKLKAYAEPFAPKKLYTDYQALLNDENVDAVYVPLPNGLHMEWAIKAAEAGKHILCEKPLAMNEEQVKKMFAAAKSNHVLLEEALCVPPCAAGPACQGDHRQRRDRPDPLSGVQALHL